MKFIYLGLINGQEMVVHVTMEKLKPNSHCYCEAYNYLFLCTPCSTYEKSVQLYNEHLESAPKYLVPYPIPSVWKVGEEVDVELVYQLTKGIDTPWQIVTKNKYDSIYHPLAIKRIVAKPVVGEEHKELTKEEKCTYPKCDCAPSTCWSLNKMDSAIAKVNRHPISSPPVKQETEDELWWEVFSDCHLNHFATFNRIVKRKFTITRK